MWKVCPNNFAVAYNNKSGTTLRSQLIPPKDAVDPTKQDGVVYRFPCKCGQGLQRREHDLQARSPVPKPPPFQSTPTTPDTSHLWSEVKFIDRDPHYYTRRVKEAIHIRLCPDNINRDGGIEIKKRGCLRSKNTTGESCDTGLPREKITEWNSKDRNAPIRVLKTNQSQQSIMLYNNKHVTSRPHRLKKTSSMQSKRRDLYHRGLHRETNGKLSFYWH